MKFNDLIQAFAQTQDLLQAHAHRTINKALVVRNWLFGYLCYDQIRQTVSGELQQRLLPAQEKQTRIAFSQQVIVPLSEQPFKKPRAVRGTIAKTTFCVIKRSMRK